MAGRQAVRAARNRARRDRRAGALRELRAGIDGGGQPRRRTRRVAGTKVPADLAYEYPTIETLSRHLAARPMSRRPDARSDRPRSRSRSSVSAAGFPAAAAQAFWQSLRDGVDAIAEVPADRFNRRGLRSGSGGPGQDEHAVGRFSRSGGSVRSAVLWHLAARGGAHGSPAAPLAGGDLGSAARCGAGGRALAGSQTGVFIGISTNDYGRLQWNDLSASMPTQAPAMP